MEYRITLPLPPSSNRLWRVFRGSVVKSGEYRAWRADAAEAIAHQLGGQPALQWFTVSIDLPRTRRDPDNSIKPLLDALQHGGAIEDDKRLRGLTLDVMDEDGELAAITLHPAEPPAPRPKGRRKRA